MSTEKTKQFEEERLIETKQIIFKKLEEAYQKLFMPIKLGKYYYYYDYTNKERLANTKESVDRYYPYIKEIFATLASLICDKDVPDIPGYIRYYPLKNFRKFLGIIPNFEGLEFKNRYESNTYAYLVSRAIIGAQRVYYFKKFEEEGKVSLETPITEFFMTTRAYRALVESANFYFKYDVLKLKHIVWFMTQKRFGPGVGDEIIQEFSTIVRITGYSCDCGITADDFTYNDRVSAYMKKDH